MFFVWDKKDNISLWDEVWAGIPVGPFKRLELSRLRVSQLWHKLTASTWAVPCYINRAGNKQNQNKHEVQNACYHMSKVVFSLTQESCVLPVAIKLLQANLLACKWGIIPGYSTQVIILSSVELVS